MENWLSLGKRLMEGSVGQTGDSAAVVVAKDSQKDSKKLSSYEEAEKREKKEKKKKKEEKREKRRALEEQLRVKQIEAQKESDDSSERVLATVGTKKIKQSEGFVYDFQMGSNLLSVVSVDLDQRP